MALPVQIEKHRVAVYIRWSTEEQGDGTTLAVQGDACRLFLQSQGWTFREDLVFVDDGYSGSSLERPGLSRLRKAVADGLVQCVVIYKLDRLSRSVLDTVTLVLREWEGVCSIRSTREPIDTTTPTGSIFFYMLASYAEWERSVIRERTLSGKIKRAQQGKNPGFTAPYGYARGAAAGQLIICEEEASVVRRVFREFIGGKGIHAVAAALNEGGVKPRRATHWRGETILKMIENPVYKGTLRYGRSSLMTGAQRRQAGKRRVFHDLPRYALVEGAVPALIPAEDWERAQQVRALRGAAAGYRARGADFLLTGIARCRCGATLRGDARATGRFYRCTGGVASNPRRCDCALMSVTQLEAAVLQEVRGLLTPANRVLLLNAWQAETAHRRAALQDEVQQARDALARTRKSRDRIAADYTAGDLPARLYAAHAEELEAAATRLEATLGRLCAELEQLVGHQNGLASLEELVGRVDSWELLKPEEQKQLLRHVVARCEVFRQPDGSRGGRGRGNRNPIEVDLQLRRFGA